MAIEDLYVSGFVIHRRASTAKVDDGGALTKDDYASHLEVSGRIRLLSASEVRTYGKEEVASTHRFYTAVADILNTDRVEDPDGVYYQILFVNNPHELDKFLQIDCMRPDHGS